LAPQGIPFVGWDHFLDATSANREALWNQAQRHLHPFPIQARIEEQPGIFDEVMGGEHDGDGTE
jgi:hypothetical protein